MDNDRLNECTQAAIESFLKMQAAAVEKDVDKAATSFYSVIKTTYAAAKEEDLFEKDKDDIILCLKGTQLMMMLMLKQEGWTVKMIKEFDDKVDKLWDVDGDDKC